MDSNVTIMKLLTTDKIDEHAFDVIIKVNENNTN